MLGSSDVITFVATKDRARARVFYEGVLGLQFVEDTPFALVFDAHGIMLRISNVDDFTPAPFTVLGWVVSDIAATAAGLVERGVKFSRYDFLEQDAVGVWTSPDRAKVAWFQDPDGNTLSLTQFPATGATEANQRWTAAKSMLRPGQIVVGQVTRHAPFGVFVMINVAFEGLVEITNFKDEGPMSPQEYPAIGALIEAVVIGFKEPGHQIWLDLRPSQLIEARKTRVHGA